MKPEEIEEWAKTINKIRNSDYGGTGLDSIAQRSLMVEFISAVSANSTFSKRAVRVLEIVRGRDES